MNALPALIGAGATLFGAKKSSDAAKQAQQAAQQAQVNIPQLNAQVVQQSIDNARRAAALEQELSPESAQLRTQSLRSLLAQLTGEADPYVSGIQEALYSEFMGGSPSVSESTLARAARDRAMADLQMGGELPLDVVNQIMRASGARAASVGGGGLGLARDISARDLGLNSLQLRDARLARAADIGAGEEQFGLNRANLELQGRGQRYGLGFGLASLAEQPFSRTLAAAQLGQQIQQPVVGLDPSAVAGIAVGNQNMVANAGQNAAATRAATGNSLIGLGGQALGFGLQRMGTPSYGGSTFSYGPVGTPATGGNYYPSWFTMPKPPGGG